VLPVVKQKFLVLKESLGIGLERQAPGPGLALGLEKSLGDSTAW